MERSEKVFLLILPSKFVRNEEYRDAFNLWYKNINDKSLPLFTPYDNKNVSVNISGINWSNWKLAIDNLKDLPFIQGMPKEDWKGKLEEKIHGGYKGKRRPLVYKLGFSVDCCKAVFEVIMEDIEEDKDEKEENINIFRRTEYTDNSDDEKSDGCDKDCM